MSTVAPLVGVGGSTAGVGGGAKCACSVLVDARRFSRQNWVQLVAIVVGGEFDTVESPTTVVAVGGVDDVGVVDSDETSTLNTFVDAVCLPPN